MNSYNTKEELIAAHIGQARMLVHKAAGLAGDPLIAELLAMESSLQRMIGEVSHA
ncbi:MAG: hypothetical protein JWO13_2724 [Acidobacteriales bacterium]|nr:hypothetical protein [Terriglobales bacterium]